jgi:RNA polymerase sigma-70 factor (ECF subfamily)
MAASAYPDAGLDGRGPPVGFIDPGRRGPRLHFLKPEPVGPRSNVSMDDSRFARAEASELLAQERALVARAREGDEEAFRGLVERHKDRAYGLALRLLRSESDAEEVAQDAFVRAWRALGDFREEAAFGTWLYRIVWRRAIDRAAVLRSRREREAPLAEVGTSTVETAVADDPARGTTAARWARLTEGLSAVQQAVVTLYYYQDLPVRDVARALDLPENTVKTHLSRARSALRERHGRDRGEETGDAL